MKSIIISCILSMIIQTNISHLFTFSSTVEGVRFFVNDQEIIEDIVTHQGIQIEVDANLYNDSLCVWYVDEQEEKRLEVEWESHGSVWIATYQPTKDTQYYVKVVGKDEQTIAISKQITYDQTKPIVEVNMNSQKVDQIPLYLKEQTKLAIRIIDEHLDSSSIYMKIEKDGELVYEGDRGYMEYEFLSSAQYEIVVKAKDYANNYVGLQETVRVDLEAPVLEVYANEKIIENGDYIFYEEVMMQFYVKDDYFLQEKSSIYVNDKIYSTSWEYREGGWYTCIPFIQDGSYHITYAIQDETGHVVQGEYQIQVDKQEPIAMLYINDKLIERPNKTYHHDVNIMFVIEEEHFNVEKSYIQINKQTIALELENGVYIGRATLTDGNYEIFYYLEDLGGHYTSYTYDSFLIDTIKPIVTVDTNYQYRIENKNIYVTAMIEDANVDVQQSEVWVEKDGHKQLVDIQQTNENQYYVSYVATKEGDYRIHMNIVDLVGNQAIYIVNQQTVKQWEDFVFSIDKTKPRIQVYGQNASVLNTQTWELELLDDDISWDCVEVLVYCNGSRIQVEMDIQKRKAYLSFQEDGTYEITVTGKDQAGNQAVILFQENVYTKSFTFVVDHQVPSITYTLSNGLLTQQTQKVNVYVNDQNLKNYSIEVIRNKKRYAYEENLTQSSWQQVFTELQESQADYEIIVIARDDANNITKEYISFTIDHAGYEIQAKLNGDTFQDNKTYYVNYDVSLVFSWNDRNAKSVILEIWKDHTKQLVTLENDTYVWKGIAEDGQEHQYRFILRAYDQVGNVTQKEYNLVIDRYLPVLQWVKDIGHGNVISGSWIPMLVGEGTEFQVLSWTLWKNQKIVSYEWNQVITEEGFYSLQVLVQDKAYNMGHLSQPFQFEIDHTAPYVQLRFSDNVFALDTMVIPKKELIVEIVQNDPLKKAEEIFTKITINGENKLSDISQTSYVFTPKQKDTFIQVEAIDKAGNITYKEWNLQVEDELVLANENETSMIHKISYLPVYSMLGIVVILYFVMKRVKKHAT